MPGFYADGEYDLAGFIVGAVERDAIIDGRRLASGDVLIGLASSGLHTNGYSLARRILFDQLGLSVDSYVPELGAIVADALLIPHRSYRVALRDVVERRLAKGLAHITGGGITDNLPRILPEGVGATIATKSWDVPALFRFLQASGGVPDAEMRRTFNMGIGMIVACDSKNADDVLASLGAQGEDARVIGELVPGKGVRYEP
jgi:phosphoribosylformylglycinamidine cyclo-ligase